MSEIKECYYANGELSSISYVNEKGKLHRDNDLPAQLMFFNSGLLKTEKYFINGQQHRENEKPAYIRYDKNGQVVQMKYFFKNKLHNKNGPASIKYYNNNRLEEKMYYVMGEYEREDPSLPCHQIFFKSGQLKTEEYYYNNKLHRENDLPAFRSYSVDGSIFSESYYIHGVKARIIKDMPSTIIYEKGKIIYKEYKNSQGKYEISDNFRQPVKYSIIPENTIYKLGKKTINLLQYAKFLLSIEFNTNPEKLNNDEVDILKLMFY